MNTAVVIRAFYESEADSAGCLGCWPQAGMWSLSGTQAVQGAEKIESHFEQLCRD